MTYREDIERALAPLREALTTLDKTISERTDELRVLRQERAVVSRVLKAAGTASGVEAPEPKRKRNRGTPGIDYSKVSPQKLDALMEWLRAHPAVVGDGFTVTSVLNSNGFNLMSRASLTNAANVLAERGLIRVDSVRSSGQRVYKLTS